MGGEGKEEEGKSLPADGYHNVDNNYINNDDNRDNDVKDEEDNDNK